jgi:hypothetical protein
MRIWFCTIVGLLLLPLDAAYISGSFPVLLHGYTWQEGGAAAAGASLYLAASIFLWRPERLYLWGHELTHLLVAKLFLKEVHGFHITSRGGGRVVMQDTNVAIDLAPYLLPFHALLLFAAVSLLPLSFPGKGEAYLAAGGYLFALHLDFTVESFFKAQPDLTRSGRILSLALVFPVLWTLVPLLAAPGAGAGFRGVMRFLEGGVEGVWRGLAGLARLAGSLAAP